MAEKRFYRSRSDRMIAGVCGGLAEYFGVDPVIVRLIFVALLVTGGVGFAAYLVLWIVTPEEGAKQSIAHDVQDQVKQDKNNHTTLALVLIVLGILFLFDNFSFIHFALAWPILLVIAGLSLLLNSANKE